MPRKRHPDWDNRGTGAITKRMSSGQFKRDQEDKHKRANIARLFHTIRRIDKHFKDEQDVFYDKIKFHKWLKDTDIRIPEIYGIIDREKNWEKFWADVSTNDSFILKPDRLSEGRGIKIIERTDDPNIWMEISGDPVALETLRKETVGVLNRFTNNRRVRGGRNRVFAEERLFVHDKFKELVVYNGIVDFRIYLLFDEVMYGKLRAPNEKSRGFGNTALGAVAMHIGIDGKIAKSDVMTNTVTKYNGKDYDGWEVPFWKDIVKTCEDVAKLFKSPFHSVDCTVNQEGEVVVIEGEKIPLLRFFTLEESKRIANDIIKWAEESLWK